MSEDRRSDGRGIVTPALVEATVETQASLEERDRSFDTGPKRLPEFEGEAVLTLVLGGCLALRYTVGLPDFANWPRNALTLFIAAMITGAIALVSTPLGREKISGVLKHG